MMNQRLMKKEKLMTQNELYNQLVNLRNKLKNQYKENGRMPTICTDDALQELASHPPRFKEELTHIEGLGDTFVEKYGNYFMEILNIYHNSSTTAVKITKNVRETLKSLENRLVNISRKNRLLFMGKVYSKNAFDMYDTNPEYNNQVLKLLSGSINQLTLCEINLKGEWNEDKRFKKALQLIREVTKEQRETGQYDLYIGYPYVIGNTFGEDFQIRAPLALFPVTYEKFADKITIKRDKEKDILFNSNLILTQNKFLGKADDLPNIILEEFNKDTFISDLINFYKTYEINILGEVAPLEKFEDISIKNFPKLQNGQYTLCNHAILGKFSMHTSAIQKDFKELCSADTINILADELLKGIEEMDSIPPQDTTHSMKEVSEMSINYINDLNSSQEQALIASSELDKLVIQGPPGTGKSQTITSLIADAVNKGKNVLMVSQKKAALDVIHSRLGNLSSFAIMLNDMKDKSGFYKQIHNLFSCNKDSSFDMESFRQVSMNIDKDIEKFSEIAKSLTSKQLNGVSLFEIYADNVNNYWLNQSDSAERDLFLGAISKQVLETDYKKLSEIFNKFSEHNLVTTALAHYDIETSHPWLKDMKPDLKLLDRKNMEKEFATWIKEQEDFLRQGFFAKLFGKSKRKKSLNILFNKYFNSNKSQSLAMNNPLSFGCGLQEYEEYFSTIHTFSELSTEDIEYLEIIHKLNKIIPDQTIDIHNKLKDFIIHYLLSDFEESNRVAMYNIENFTAIASRICRNMQDKKDLCKTRLKDTLATQFYTEILMSKRYLEICRQIENTRKWSVAKFVKKFSFELFSGIKIWLMTPETVSEVLPLENGLFDLLIFDEASQIYIEKGIPSIVRAKKVVIAGDHQQLRPSSLGFGRIDIDDENLLEDDEANAALEEESLLDLARFKYPSVLLNYHYRAKYEELINFSNYAFYDGRLNVSPNTDTPETPPIEFIKIDDGMWTNRCNRKEAQKIVSLVKKVFKTRQNNETIGIITFNTNQRDIILDELDRECLKDQDFASLYKKELIRENNGEDIGIFVKNIENVQGDERDHIIFSIGYAQNEDGKIVRNFGWLNQDGGENRLNVAISRAKRKITIVASIFPEELYVDDLKNDGPKLFRKYLDYAWAISNRDSTTASAILQSLASVETQQNISKNTPLVSQICQELSSLGLDVETNVGMGNYKVDIAVKSPKGNNLIGIELDSNLYTLNIDTRERDIFRKNYFECRGWKIYRLWSINWWKNKDKELDNIVKLYNSLNK